MAPPFRPEEVQFSLTTDCNLKCPHCTTTKVHKTLAPAPVLKFLAGCKDAGIKRIGFTGGEPFLAPDFLCTVTKEALRRGFLFDRIMTNGVWYKSDGALISSLEDLHEAGYDGEICISVDAFHNQDLGKIARFIKAVSMIWQRADMVSLACVTGARDAETQAMLKRLCVLLGARLAAIEGKHPHIKNKSLFIKIFKIGLAPVGKAARLKMPWDGKWFKEDYCRGPGNVLFVDSDGKVKPCCGFAADSERLTIGDIKYDSAVQVVKNAGKNNLVSTIFDSGLTKIRKALESLNVKFPGKTSSHCYFCDYVIRKIPSGTLNKCLRRIMAVFFIGVLILLNLSMPSLAEEYTMKRSKEYKLMPASVAKVVTIPKWYHEGLFYDGKSVWVANGEGGKIWVIDPDGGSLISEIESCGGFTEAITRRSDGALFVSDWSDKKLYRVKLEESRLVPESGASFAPAHPAGAVWADGHLFVITWIRSIFGTKFYIIELDSECHEVNKIKVKGIQEPCQLAWDGKFLWVTSWYNKLFFKIDISKWEITGYCKSPVFATTGITWDGKFLWITGTNSDLYQMEVPS